MRLDVTSFALTAAILVGAASFLVTLFSVLTGFASEFFRIIAPFHPGYTPTVAGAFISACWMFAYALIGGLLFSYIYNLLLRKPK